MSSTNRNILDKKKLQESYDTIAKFIRREFFLIKLIFIILRYFSIIFIV